MSNLLLHNVTQNATVPLPLQTHTFTCAPKALIFSSMQQPRLQNCCRPFLSISVSFYVLSLTCHFMALSFPCLSLYFVSHCHTFFSFLSSQLLSPTLSFSLILSVITYSSTLIPSHTNSFSPIPSASCFHFHS